jgi:hypothetical protein
MSTQEPATPGTEFGDAEPDDATDAGDEAEQQRQEQERQAQEREAANREEMRKQQEEANNPPPQS